MPPGKQHHTWAQAAGKGLNSACISSGNSGSIINENDSVTLNSAAINVTKMGENANESQIAAAYSEGWGQRGVNQDTSWDVPNSPQCSPKEGTAWSGSTKNGTEIWESNVRHLNKGPNVSTPGQMREPWGHAPATHIGGTWGEEEDTTNLWTGTPQPANPPWAGDANSSVWGTNPGDGKNWGVQNSAAVNFSTWGSDAAPLQIGLAHLPIANEPKNIEDSGTDGGQGTGVWSDSSHKRAFSNWSPITGKKAVQPSGWEETAPPPPPPPPAVVACQPGGNYDDGTAVWGNPVHQGKVSHWKEMPPTKQMPNCIMPPTNFGTSGSPCAGPGMIRLPPAGTNLNKSDSSWMKGPALGRGINWTDISNHRDNSGRRIWDDLHNQIQDKNVPGTPTTPNSAFGNWADPSHSASSNFWGAKNKNMNSGWSEGQVDTSSWGGPMKQGGKPLTKDLIWASKQFRLLSEMNFKKDDIENALRHNNMNLEESLMELHSLNKESSVIDMENIGGLNLNHSRIPHGGVDDINFAEQPLDNSIAPGSLYGGNSFSGISMFSTGFNVAQNCKNQASVGNNATPNVLGNTGSNNQAPNFNLNNGINSMSPAMVRKLLQHSQAFNPACLPQNAINNQAGRLNQQNFPSTAQLRHLVQQIQMAVQAGHLNPQILNQPLAPQTLQLLYQLLQQIRVLHQLQQQQLFYTQHSNKPSSPPLQLSVQITQTKQHIVNFQNQIAAQQAIFLKQQNVQLPLQHPSLQTPQPSAFDVVKSNLDAINGLHMDFRDLSVKESTSQSHSRLTQWKLSPFDKEDSSLATEASVGGGCNRENASSCASTEFSRAPGSMSKSSSANSLSSTTAPHSSSGLQPLSENTWADMPHPQKDSWMTESGEPSNPSSQVNKSGSSGITVPVGDMGSVRPCDGALNSKLISASDKDSPATVIPSTSSSSQSYNLNDLVPEFEPGKPWKGTSRIKNFEDDPHITPGSIAKSPLSLNSIKDTDLFTWSTKPNASSNSSSSTSSLTTSTWSFSPPLGPSASQTGSSLGKHASKTWGSRPTESTTNWKGRPIVPKTLGPPPGLAGQQTKAMSSNWMYNDSGQHNWSSSSGWDKQGSSNFLVLRNLTHQIDGSTLKTLCMQHGPLQLFQLILNHGIALIRYSSREESEKARCALNNCVFGNTTILVDIPTESEVKQYLQLASGQNISWSQGGNVDPPFGANSAYPLCSSNGGASNVAAATATDSKSNSDNWKNSPNLNLPGSNLWSFTGNGSSSSDSILWSMHPSINSQDQGIPSSLNSLLPGDLLGGGEPI